MKAVRNLALLLCASFALISTTSCVAVVHRPQVVYVAPLPGTVEWWFDGYHYYYLDPGTGIYFYHGPNGEIIWARGWHPRAEWLRVGTPSYHPVWKNGRPVRGVHYGGSGVRHGR
jgi:hypothetical protein